MSLASLRSMTLETHLEQACLVALEAQVGIAHGTEGASPPEKPHCLTLLSHAVAACGSFWERGQGQI